MHEPDTTTCPQVKVTRSRVTIAPDLKTLIRQTGVVHAVGAGCALTLLAFAAPISVAAWLRGWSWWLAPATLAGLVLAGLVGLLAARRIAVRTLTRLADGPDGEPGEDADDDAPPDPHQIAEALLRTILLGEGDPADLFDGLREVDPAVGAEAAAVLRERAVDDLVNGTASDEVRLGRFTDVVRAAGDGARRLRGTPAGEPWQAVAEALGQSLRELVAAMQEEADEPGMKN